MYKKISLRELLDRIMTGNFGNVFIQAKEDKSLTRADMWEWKFAELHMHDFYEYQDGLIAGAITKEDLETVMESFKK